MRKFGPYKILRKFDSRNTYEVELPNDIDISPIFNFFVLHEYYESKDDEVSITDDYPKKKTEEVEQILG